MNMKKTLGLVKKFDFSREEIDKLYGIIDEIEIEAGNINNYMILKRLKT